MLTFEVCGERCGYFLQILTPPITGLEKIASIWTQAAWDRSAKVTVVMDGSIRMDCRPLIQWVGFVAGPLSLRMNREAHNPGGGRVSQERFHLGVSKIPALE